TLELIKFALESECRLLPVLGMDSDLVIALNQVEFGENLCVAQMFENLVDSWHGVSIFFADLVEWAIIDRDSNSAIWFGHRHYVRTPRTFAQFDDVLLP